MAIEIDVDVMGVHKGDLYVYSFLRIMTILCCDAAWCLSISTKTHPWVADITSEK